MTPPSSPSALVKLLEEIEERERQPMDDMTTNDYPRRAS